MSHDRKRGQKYRRRLSDQRESLQRRAREERTARKHGVALTHWGVCPDCGRIGAPNHRCSQTGGTR